MKEHNDATAIWYDPYRHVVLNRVNKCISDNQPYDVEDTIDSECSDCNNCQCELIEFIIRIDEIRWDCRYKTFSR